MSFKKITSLSLASSMGCNLQCKYCYIAQNNKNIAHSSDLQEKTIAAFEDGSFLKNTIEVLKRTGNDPKNINSISFWAQEPTLTLDHFTNHMSDWMDAYPNNQYMEFSTNGVGFPERIVRFISEADKTIKYDHGRIMVQFSYDGEYSTSQIRGADVNRIKENIAYVITELNRIVLNKIHVEIQFHAVTSFELMHYLDTDEKLTYYFDELQRFPEGFHRLSTNPNVEVGRFIGINLEGPYDASTEDGIFVASFLRRCLAIDSFLYSRPKFLCGSTVSGLMLRSNVLGHEFGPVRSQTIRAALNHIMMTGKADDLTCMSSYCSTNMGSLKIRFDGMIISCQNQIFDTDIDYIEAEDTVISETKRSLIKKNYFINPLTASDEEILKHFKKFYDIKDTSFAFRLNQVCNLMYLLACTHQIDPIYLVNHEKFMRHAYFMTLTLACSYNCLVKTGTLTLKDTGTIRMYCNGLLDIVEDWALGDDYANLNKNGLNICKSKTDKLNLIKTN